jgi:hypothetical protein
VNIWPLIILLFISGFAHSQEGDTDIPEEPVNWVDDGHAYTTNKVQALTQWTDDFFGDPVNDLEQAESFFRMQLVDDWDGDDGHNFKVRMRGKVQLPKVSKRLDLVLSGSEEEQVDEDEREDEDNISLQFKLSEGKKSRFDLTLGWASSNVRPGVRYRNEGPIGDVSSYRFLERLQWQDGKGVFSTTQVDLYRAMPNDNLLRWSGRIKYGEETDGMEWRSKWVLSQRYQEDTKRPIATATFLSINGVTQRDKYTKNYRLGFLFRRQMYRDFFFLELEPAYNYRRLEYEEERAGVWSLVVRLEIVLEKDLRRLRKADSE